MEMAKTSVFKMIFSLLVAAMFFNADNSFAQGKRENVGDPLTIAKAVADKELFGRVINSDSERPKVRVHHSLYWTDATLMAGLTDLYDRLEQTGAPVPRYLDYLESWAARDPGGYPIPIFHGDMVGAGQTYVWLYERSGKKSNHLERTRGMLDLVFKGRKYSQLGTGYNDYWMLFWIDDTFMVPTYLAARGRAAGSAGMPNHKDGRTVAMEYLRAYDDVLLDPKTGLYWHDRDTLGKYHWGRGQGWAAASFYKVMKVMEEDPAYQQDALWLRGKLIDMSKALKDNRNPVGTWNADIIHRKTYSAPETSGTVFFVYMMANMINDGYLPDEYIPVVQKAWHFLTLSVTNSGRLMRVQPVGNRPVKIDFEGNSESFGVGGFLMAAAAMSRFPQQSLDRAGQVQCLELNPREFKLSQGQAMVSLERLRALDQSFPSPASGKVQAVFPARPLPKTGADDRAGTLSVSDFPVSYQGPVYLFFDPSGN